VVHALLEVDKRLAAPERTLEIVPVSDKVNSVKNNSPELLEPVDPSQVEEPIQLDLLS